MPKKKLDKSDIEHLLKVAATGLLTQQQIAEDWGISKGYVSRLVTGKYIIAAARKVSFRNAPKEV